jgi:surface antigen
MKKITAVGVGFALTTGMLVSSATSASATSTTTCTSIAYACTPDYTGNDGQYSYSAWANTNVYGYKHNCTMYIAWLFSISLPYHPEFNLLGDASEWAVSASKLGALGVSVSKVPKRFRVAQWNSGHVAFVTDIQKDPYGNPVKIFILEDNFSGTTSARQITTGVGWPDNFIDFGMDFSTGLPGTGGGNGSPGIVNLNSVDGVL